MITEQMKKPQNLIVLMNIQLFFFFNKHSSDSSDCCKPFVNLQSSENIDFDHFLQVFSLFFGGTDFQKYLLPLGSTTPSV